MGAGRVNVRLRYARDGALSDIVVGVAVIPRKGEVVVLRDGDLERSFKVRLVEHLVDAPTGVVAVLSCVEQAPRHGAGTT